MSCKFLLNFSQPLSVTIIDFLSSNYLFAHLRIKVFQTYFAGFFKRLILVLVEVRFVLGSYAETREFRHWVLNNLSFFVVWVFIIFCYTFTVCLVVTIWIIITDFILTFTLIFFCLFFIIWFVFFTLHILVRYNLFLFRIF